MKTRKLNKDILHKVAYVDGYDSSERWIDTYCYGVIFTSELSTCSYVIRRYGDAFEVDVRNFRKRSWSLLFYSSSARSVLQDLYDFLYF